MKLRIGTLALAVFLLLALALGARLAWVASQLETGAETLALSWRGATLGQVGWPRVPLCDRPAADQADFWLAEVDRILAEREPSAELLMGAAWLLDWPGSSDPYNDLSPAGLAQGGPFPPDGDGSSGYRAEEFEAKCSARCLELATAATEREPGNVGLWRMRALLLFRFSYGNDTQDARRADWRAQLDECARHDPDNALYDYLAARHLWRGNLQSDWHGDDEVFWVEDPERFAEGTARLEQGLKKKHFTVGATAIPGAAELVRHARLPHVEQTNVAMGVGVNDRATSLLWDLRYDLSDQARVRQWGEDSTGAAILYCQGRRMDGQVAADDWPEVYRWARLWERHYVGDLLELPKTAFAPTPPEEMADLQRQWEALRVEGNVISTAMEQLGSSVGVDLIRHNKHQNVEAVVPALVMARTLKLAVALLVLGGIGLVVSRWLIGRSRPSHHLGPLRHAAAWTVACGGTFLVLGIWPSAGLEKIWLRLAIAGLAWLVGMVALAALFRRTVRLCRQWARRPDEPPVVAMALVVTLWQVTVVALLTVNEVLGIWADLLDEPLSWSQQTSIVLCGVLAAVVVVAVGVWIGRVLRRRQRIGRFLPAPFVASGLLLLSAILVVEAFGLCTDFPELIPRIRHSYLGESVDYVLPGSRQPFWHWAVLFWIACAGVLVATIGSLLIIAVWYTVRRHKKRAADAPVVMDCRAYWGGLLANLGRSSLTVAAVCLLIHLAIAPGVLRTIEDNYHWRIGYLADPPAHWTEFHEAVEAIEADPVEMARIRADVAAELSWQGPEEWDDSIR